MPHLWRDLRHTLRGLAIVPALSATIVATVGIGLGVTVATLVLVKAVLIDPLPYADPERLAWIYTDNPPYKFPLSVVDYRALEAEHPAFSAIAAISTWVRKADPPVRLLSLITGSIPRYSAMESPERKSCGKQTNRASTSRG